jgi:hypothetical protein
VDRGLFSQKGRDSLAKGPGRTGISQSGPSDQTLTAQKQRGAGWRRCDAGDSFRGGVARGSPELDVPVVPVAKPSRLQAREHRRGTGNSPRVNRSGQNDPSDDTAVRGGGLAGVHAF